MVSSIMTERSRQLLMPFNSQRRNVSSLAFGDVTREMDEDGTLLTKAETAKMREQATEKALESLRQAQLAAEKEAAKKKTALGHLLGAISQRASQR